MGFEFRFLDFLQSLRTPAGDAFFRVFTHLGDLGIVWILLIVAFLISKRYRKLGITAMAALLLELIICNAVIKNIVARPRPFEFNQAVELLIKRPDDYSFPSGHAGASFAVTFAFLFALLYKPEKNRIITTNERLMVRWITVMSFVVAVMISLSRMYLYVHYPTDILAGLVLGFLTGFISVLLMPRVFEKAGY